MGLVYTEFVFRRAGNLGFYRVWLSSFFLSLPPLGDGHKVRRGSSVMVELCGDIGCNPYVHVCAVLAPIRVLARRLLGKFICVGTKIKIVWNKNKGV